MGFGEGVFYVGLLGGLGGVEDEGDLLEEGED